MTEENNNNNNNNSNNNNSKDNNGGKIQMTLGLKSMIVTPEQLEKLKEEQVELSAFQKVHHWIYAKYHRPDGKIKGWLMGLTLGIIFSLATIAIRLVSK
jgi:hypothetical protein